MTFFHGGVPRLGPGDTIRPRARLRAWRGASVRYAAVQGFTPGDRSGQFVYLTSDSAFAAAFASDYVAPNGYGALTREPGDVYEVEPVGATDPDPDFSIMWPEVFVRAAAAIVVRVVDRAVVMTDRQTTEARGPYMRWADHSPVYTSDGHILPSPRMRAAGVSADDLRTYEPWFPIEGVPAAGPVGARRPGRPGR